MKPNSKDELTYKEWFEILIDICANEGVSLSPKTKWERDLHYNYQSGETPIEVYQDQIE